MSTVTRDNFDRFWLTPSGGAPRERKQRQPASTPAVDSLIESADSRPTVLQALLSAIYDHHIHPGRIHGCLVRLGHPRAVDVLLRRLPKDDRTRKGNFGEVVASEHLRQRHGYAMPVFKLRYADHPGLPMRGEDIIAFELVDGNLIVTVCIGEAKVRLEANGTEVREAHTRLHQAYHPHPIALSLISTVLRDRNEQDLADQVDQLMEEETRSTVPRHNWIFLISQDSAGAPFGVLADDAALIKDLRCVHIRLADLQAFIDTLFSSPIPEPL